MEKESTSSSHELAQRLYDQNIELENRRKKSMQARIPSDPNAWLQMRENYEAIILKDYNFSEQHNIEYALWQLHYRRIEEFRAHFSAASASKGSTASQTGRGSTRSDRVSKIRLQFKTFLSEATGFYHDLILKIRAKYGLPIGHFPANAENQIFLEKDAKRSVEMKRGLVSCHRCLIYVGDLARYKGLYGEGESRSLDYAAASSYYLQAASLWPSSGNPHHQLAILATYSGDELAAVYRYFRSLAVDSPFPTAKDNLVVAFEKNRQSYSRLHGSLKTPSIEGVGASNKGGKMDIQSEEANVDASSVSEKAVGFHEIYKIFCTRFVRLNGILFTRSSLETFGETLALVSSALQDILSSMPEEESSYGADGIDNRHMIVMLASLLIFIVNYVKVGGEGQSYADIVQRALLLQNALVAVYELMEKILRSCLRMAVPSTSYLLPAIMVFVEWLASCPDVSVRLDDDDKHAAIKSNFWNIFVSFLNKLLSDSVMSVDVQDMARFFSMNAYEERKNVERPALWEDYELRGFLPLKPAHNSLDFSRKHGDSHKEKIARIERILAAGKALVDVVRTDQRTIIFDSNTKKFVIGVEKQKLQISQTNSRGPQANGEIDEIRRDSTPYTAITQPKEHLYMEGEEDDEVIVFKPSAMEKQNDMAGSRWNHQERLEPAPIGTFDSSQFNVDPVSSHTYLQNQNGLDAGLPSVLSLADGVKNSSLVENGQRLTLRMLEDKGIFPTAPSLPIQQPIGVGLSSMPFSEPKSSESAASSSTYPWKTFTSQTASYKKHSANRPVRHLGPPPGFSSVRPKQANELISGSGHNPAMDDYSWLDGYQIESSITGLPSIQPNAQPSYLSSQYINNGNGSLGANRFSLTGNQVPTLHFEEGTQKSLQDHQNLGSINSHQEQQQQQFISLSGEQKGQPIWADRHLV